MKMKLLIKFILTAIIASCGCGAHDSAETETRQTMFHIDGKLKVDVGGERIDENWTREIRIVVDDGQHIGIPK